MKSFFSIISIILLSSTGCMTPQENSQNDFPDLSGSYDNFLQYWKQNTDDEIHKEEMENPHDHIHLKFEKQEEPYTYEISFFKDRNNSTYLDKKTIHFKINSNTQDDHAGINMTKENNGWTSEDRSIQIIGDTIRIKGLGVYQEQKEIPYELIKCRFFSGWLQYPISNNEEEDHWLRDLEIHDQGGMAELDIDGVDYTVELTQLVYGHTIKLMKIAIYDMPMAEVEINSRAISYAWTSPEAKRLGINLRKIVSGWTLIEPGFINSNTMNDDE